MLVALNGHARLKAHADDPQPGFDVGLKQLKSHPLLVRDKGQFVLAAMQRAGNRKGDGLRGHGSGISFLTSNTVPSLLPSGRFAALGNSLHPGAPSTVVVELGAVAVSV
jgi:hypothetical protein